jgi:hypothetical protein
MFRGGSEMSGINFAVKRLPFTIYQPATPWSDRSKWQDEITTVSSADSSRALMPVKVRQSDGGQQARWLELSKRAQRGI